MKLVKLLFNKYIITLAVFAVIMLFFDQNDWVSMREREQQLKDAKETVQKLNAEIAEMDTAYAALMRTPQALEKHAREHYRMKRDNEDLYVVEKQQ